MRRRCILQKALKSAPLLIAVVLVLAGVGGAVFALSIGRPDPADGARVPSRPDAVAVVPTSPAPAGRGPNLDGVMRDLELIRPSRQKVAEDFTLRTVGGSSFRLREHRGKPVLVNFWATWCLPCREEMLAMERLYQKHKDDLVLVAVSLDADPVVVPPYVKASKLTFPIALDPKAEVGNTYGVRALPSSFVVDRDGTLLSLALGPRHWDNPAAHDLVDGLATSAAR